MKALRVDETAFTELYPLFEDNKWLSRKSKAVLELYNFCDTSVQQDIILHLIREFKHVSSTEVETLGEMIAAQIEKEWKLLPSDTIISAISDHFDVDGSQAFLQVLKNKFENDEWSADNFINKIGKGIHKVKDGGNFILFDDFIGSGETIIRKYDWSISKLKNLNVKNANVFIIAFASMNFSLDTIKEHQISIYTPLVLKKGITDHFDEHTASSYIKELGELEKKLEPYSNDIHLEAYKLGYNKSEAIFTFEAYNIPDNVFPIFWWPEVIPKIKRRTLFKRL